MNGKKERTAKDSKDAAYFMDQSGLKGIRDVPGRGEVDLSCGPDDRSGGRQGRHCKAHAGLWLRRIRNCAAVPGRCLPRGLRGTTRRGNLGGARVPKEIA